MINDAVVINLSFIYLIESRKKYQVWKIFVFSTAMDLMRLEKFLDKTNLTNLRKQSNLKNVQQFWKKMERNYQNNFQVCLIHISLLKLTGS